MFMVNGGLRVGLLTDHVPVKDIAKHITTSIAVSGSKNGCGDSQLASHFKTEVLKSVSVISDVLPVNGSKLVAGLREFS